MILKSSFSNMVRQQHRNFFWYPIVVFVYFFLVLEVQLLMRLQDIEKWPDRFSYGTKHLLSDRFFTVDENIIMTVSVCGLGCITALLLFSFVQSRKKLDLIHSLPVKRGTVFGANYLTGVSFFVLPMIVHSMLVVFIASVKGCMSGRGLVHLLAFMGCQLLFYLLTYSMTIIAIMLTGNFPVSIVATIIVQCYSFFIDLLKNSLYYEFFHTAVSGKIKPVYAFSPVHMVSNICIKMSSYREENMDISYGEILGYAGVILLAVVIFSVIGYSLYRFRSTEAAGRAIAFPQAEAVIKCLLCIPVSLAIGYMFYDVASANSFGWMIFGVIFSFVVFCIVSEMIFRMNVRAGLKHWYHILFNGACVCLIVTIFKTDVLGFNTYVPSYQEVEHLAVSLDDVMYLSRWGDVSYTDSDIVNYRLRNVNIQDKATYDFISSLAKEQLQYPESSTGARVYSLANSESPRNYHEITVCYYLHNGKEVYRKYLYDFDKEDHKQNVAKIFNSREYKLGSFPILLDGWNMEINQLVCEGMFNGEAFVLEEKQKNELLNAYQSDIMNLTLEQVITKRPLYVLELRYKLKNDKERYEEGYRVYESFTKTRTFLESLGVDSMWDAVPESIQSVTLTYYNFDEDKKEFPTQTVTDQEQILEILQNAASYSMMQGTRFVPNDYEIDIDVEYFNTHGNKHYRYMTFFNNQIPQFVLELFGI